MVPALIGVDGAEGKVLSGRQRSFGQHVEKGGLSNVGQTYEVNKKYTSA
jgi:hypothetical protein